MGSSAGRGSEGSARRRAAPARDGSGGDTEPLSVAGVVVVDDDADIRRVVRAVFDRSEPFVIVAEASDGAEAIEVVTETQPDIVLLDLLMPHMTGQEALPELLRASPQSMIVALTALSADASADETFRVGAFAYLEKSVIGSQLVDELADLYRLWQRALAGEKIWVPPSPYERVRR